MTDTPDLRRLGTCDKKQYEHAGLHAQIADHGQAIPPFPCWNWVPALPELLEKARAMTPEEPCYDTEAELLARGAQPEPDAWEVINRERGRLIDLCIAGKASPMEIQCRDALNRYADVHLQIVAPRAGSSPAPSPANEQPCPKCWGGGYITVGGPSDAGMTGAQNVRCTICGGTGRVTGNEGKDAVSELDGRALVSDGNHPADSDGDTGGNGPRTQETLASPAVPVITVGHGADPMAGGAIWVKNHNVEVLNEASPAVVTPPEGFEPTVEWWQKQYNALLEFGKVWRAKAAAEIHMLERQAEDRKYVESDLRAKVSELEAQLQQARKTKEGM